MEFISVFLLWQIKWISHFYYFLFCFCENWYESYYNSMSHDIISWLLMRRLFYIYLCSIDRFRWRRGFEYFLILSNITFFFAMESYQEFFCRIYIPFYYVFFFHYIYFFYISLPIVPIIKQFVQVIRELITEQQQ